MTQLLLAYVCSDFSEADVAELRALATRLADEHAWTAGLPGFVDETDASSCSKPGDEPVRTVGIVLPVSTPGVTPQSPVSEVESWLGELVRFSREQHVDFEVQLDQTYAGEIRSGELDRLVREGLLQNW